MSDSPTSASKRRTDSYVFRCENCGTRRVRPAISYNRYGYAVCPACSYESGP